MTKLLNFVPFLDKYEYVTKEERELNSESATIFYIRPLSVKSQLEIAVAENNSDIGLIEYIWLRDCLIGWDNFDETPFCEENINSVPKDIQKELIDYAKSISIPTLEILDEFKFLIRWGNYLSDSRKSRGFVEWQCDKCIEANLQKSRNCPLLSDEERESLEDFKEKTAKYMMGTKKVEPFRLVLGGITLNECPVPRNNDIIRTMLHIINYCENMKVNPHGKGLFEESYYFLVCYNTVVGEINDIQNEKINESKNKNPDKNTSNKESNKLGKK